MANSFVWRDAFGHEFHYRFRFYLFSQDENSFWHLSRLVIRIRNHCGVSNARMRQQHCFEFSGRYLKTFIFDQLLRTIDDEEVSIFICVSDVACVQPTVGVDRSRGCFRVVQVTHHNLRPAHTDLTFLIWTKWLAGFEVDDLTLSIRRGNSNRAELDLHWWRRR